MKKKLILLTLLGVIFTFIIYYYTKNDNLTILALGDGLSSGMTSYDIEGLSFNDYMREDYKLMHKLNKYYEYAYANLTIKELTYQIKNNDTILYKDKQVELQQAINEADIITIAIGLDELASVKITSQIRHEFTNDFKELLSTIKSLNHKQVIVLSIYNIANHDLLSTSKINAIIRDLTLSNNFTFVDISKIITKDYFLTNNSHYLNFKAHKQIYEQIKPKINQKV